MFIFLLPIILCLHRSLLNILLCPKKVILYIAYNIIQLVYLLDHMKPFSRVNNWSVTLNIAINYVQPSLKHPLQIPIANSILHYVTCDAVQRGWIDQTVLIIDDLNTKIGTDGFSPIPPICPFTTITHILKEPFLWLLIIVKYLCD